MIRKEFTLDVSSDPQAGARNVTADGTSFEVHLEEGISIPSNAINPTVRAIQATVWNNEFNISQGFGNNKMYILENAVWRVLTIPDGSYGVDELNTAVDREYVAQGGTSGLITISDDQPTQKVEITINGAIIAPATAQIDFTQADTPRQVVGFANKFVPAAPTAIFYQELGSNQAQFNNIEYFKIHADIGQGIRTNNTYDQTVARVNLTAAPGSQITDEPFNPPRIDATSLIGILRKNFKFWLTNQANLLISTNEIWSVALTFEYLVPFPSA